MNEQQNLEEQKAVAAPEAVTETESAPEEAAFDWDNDAILPDETEPAEAAGPLGEKGPPGESGLPTDETPSEDVENEPSDGKEEPSESPQEPDYKALYEGLQDQKNAERFRQVYNEQLALTGNDALSRMIAANECGGKSYPLEEASERETPGPSDFRAALTEIQSLYPDAREMPQEVMNEYMSGRPLTESYAAYRAKQDGETIADLRRQVDALRKAASNRAAAPVTATTGQNAGAEDLYLKGFDSDTW